MKYKLKKHYCVGLKGEKPAEDAFLYPWQIGEFAK
jgi:hypothetical protein